jgi:crotonobetainyl-CoA:carnitine CoA-transferase CaiB-like acyl-CoA transferase
MNAGFLFEHDGPGVTAPPPRYGEHSEEVLAALGFEGQELRGLLAIEQTSQTSQ